MTETNTEYGDLSGYDGSGQVGDGLFDHRGVTGTVGDEETVVVGFGVKVVVLRLAQSHIDSPMARPGLLHHAFENT